MTHRTPTVLVIAGYDPYGGAGVLVDTKTIHALGGYALAVPTAMTAQNSQGVIKAEAAEPAMLEVQLTALLDDIRVDAVKIGMLASQAVIDVVSDALKQYALANIVLDPVMISTSGRALLEPDAVAAMVETLFPLACLITPNLDEANALLGTSFSGQPSEIDTLADGVRQLGAKATLLKGGHIAGTDAVDTLIEDQTITSYRAPRITTSHTHGTGCILSSAIALHLSQGMELPSAVEKAKQFLHQQLTQADTLTFAYRHSQPKRHEPVF
jgi:hydroxymethylpyrimidine/phosphomethylpyrimidine kinase